MTVIHLFPRKGGGRGKGHGKGGPKGSPAARKHAPASFTNSRFADSFLLSGTKSSASPYSDGGGKSLKLNNGVFSGRLAGGGKRVGSVKICILVSRLSNFVPQDSVYGTRVYGSGYPYGGSGFFLSSRPFPYGFYPVPVYRYYYGSEEVFLILPDFVLF